MILRLLGKMIELKIPGTQYVVSAGPGKFDNVTMGCI